MAQFQFRMAALLRIREALRDQCRVSLAESHRAEAELLKKIERLAQKQEQLRRDRRKGASPGEVDVARLAEAERYASILQQREARLCEERAALDAEIERRRVTLMEADRDVRSLEKLRETQHEAYRLEENRQDVKRLDEVASQMASW